MIDNGLTSLADITRSPGHERVSVRRIFVPFSCGILRKNEETVSSSVTVSFQNCRWSQDNTGLTITCRDQYSFNNNICCDVFDIIY